MTTSFATPDVSGTSALAALRGAGFEAGSAVAVTRTVLDTFDGRLHRAGLRLEHRSAPEPALVLVEADVEARLAWPEPVAWPHDLPPGPFRERLAAVTEERALFATLTITSRCTTAHRRDRRGKATATVELHQRLEVAADAAPPAWVAVLRPVTGHADVADSAIARLAAAGLEPVDGDLATVVARAIGFDLRGSRGAVAPRLHHGDDALAASKAVLGSLAGAIAANLPGTLDRVDPEFLHQLRVSIRQTRSVLGELDGAVPEGLRSRFRTFFGDLGQATGPPRDLDVQLLGWDDVLATLDPEDQAALGPVRPELERRQARVHRELGRLLRLPRTQRGLAEWQAWTAAAEPPAAEAPGEPPAAEPPAAEATGEPPAAEPPADGSLPIGPFVEARIRRLHHRLVRDGRRIGDESPPEALHDLRKEAKRLRYVVEGFAGLYAAKPRKAYLARLKELQENLGAHQDAEVQVTELRALGEDLNRGDRGGTALVLAIGHLVDRLEARRQAERDVFAKRFADYARPTTATLLDRMLDSAAGR